MASNLLKYTSWVNIQFWALISDFKVFDKLFYNAYMPWLEIVRFLSCLSVGTTVNIFYFVLSDVAFFANRHCYLQRGLKLLIIIC